VKKYIEYYFSSSVEVMFLLVQGRCSFLAVQTPASQHCLMLCCLQTSVALRHVTYSSGPPRLSGRVSSGCLYVCVMSLQSSSRYRAAIPRTTHSCR